MAVSACLLVHSYGQLACVSVREKVGETEVFLGLLP